MGLKSLIFARLQAFLVFFFSYISQFLHTICLIAHLSLDLFEHVLDNRADVVDSFSDPNASVADLIWKWLEMGLAAELLGQKALNVLNTIVKKFHFKCKLVLDNMVIIN